MFNVLNGRQGLLHEDTTYIIASTRGHDEVSFHFLILANKTTVILNLYENVRCIIKKPMHLIISAWERRFLTKQKTS